MSLVESEPDARKDTRFQPGNNRNPAGRPKGSRNKLGEAFVQDVYTAWQTQGNAVIQRVIDERPQDFLKIVANILPKDVNIKVTQLDDLSDEQLLRKLNSLTEMARPLLARITDGNSAVSGPQQDPVPIVDAEYTDVSKA